MMDEVENMWSLGHIHLDVFEHDVLPFVPYHDLVHTLSFVCKEWYAMANKKRTWFDGICRHRSIHPDNLNHWMNLYFDHSRPESYHLTFSDDHQVYFLKRLYFLASSFPTKFLTPAEDDARQFFLGEAIKRDERDPNVLIYQHDDDRDINLRSNRRVPNIYFKPIQESNETADSEDTPMADESSKLVKEMCDDVSQILPVYYWEIRTEKLDKPPLPTPPPFSPFGRRVIAKNKPLTKKGRNSIGIIHNRYLTSRQVGWDDCGAGFHTDDGKVFANEAYGASAFPHEGCIIGDVIGCGFYAPKKLVFFTRNGQFLLAPAVFNTEKEDIRFGIGFWKNIKVHCNFGAQPFMYNIENARQDIDDFLGRFPLDQLTEFKDEGFSYDDSSGSMHGFSHRLGDLRRRVNRANELLNQLTVSLNRTGTGRRIAYHEPTAQELLEELRNLLPADTDVEINEQDNDDNDDSDYVFSGSETEDEYIDEEQAQFSDTFSEDDEDNEPIDDNADDE